MNSLPPLRTAAKGPTPAAKPNVAELPQLQLALPNMAMATKQFLTELVQSSILTIDDVTQFCQSDNVKLHTLGSRDQTAAALTRAGFLTPYQATRILQGQTSGMRFGGYRVLDRLGSGSIGIVFLAEHRELNRQVAVKVLSLTESIAEPIRIRFQKEIRIMASLRHDHIATIYDAGVVLAASPEQSDMHYLAMEYLPGGDVENYVYEQGLQSLGQVCEWGRQVVSALWLAHASGLVHRDVKPSNILLDEMNRIKLIDFGLAREFDSVMTAPRVLVGSLDFLAPEQVMDAATAGPASDVYSLGVTLFWLLSGELPIAEHTNSACEKIQLIIGGQRRPLGDVAADLPNDVKQIIDSMLCRSPDDRPDLARVEKILSRHAFTSPLTENEADDEPTQLRRTIHRLEEIVIQRENEADNARHAMLTALAAIVEVTGKSTPKQQARMSAYIEVLTGEMRTHPDWPMLADRHFVQDLIYAAQARNIGLVGLKEDEDQNHPRIGGGMLDAVARTHGASMPALRVARDVVEQHHERWDGTGSPNQLSGDGIVPAARIVALLDRYDQLRVDDLSHVAALQVITDERGRGFEPTIVDAFQKVDRLIEQVWRVNPEHEEATAVPVMASRRQAFERIRKQAGE